MLFVTAFLLFFGSATTMLLLVADSYYARDGVQQRLDPTHGRHWTPSSAVLLEDPVAGPSALPTGIRRRLWMLSGIRFVLGCLLLVLAL